MTSEERHEQRYQRRKFARQLKKQSRADSLGSLDFLYCYTKLFKYGLHSCRDVRWKCSVQEFEMSLFSGTAARRRKILNGTWRPDNYVHFLINERGKTRPIDAPRVQDRQVNKLYTKEVLLPLYLPDMIWNNGASLEGKGFKFSQDQLTKELRHHMNKYGINGKIILLDFHHFFPQADHQIIYNRHARLILNNEIKDFGDLIIRYSPKDIGLPLGIETSQAEMIAYPSPLDNFIKCQLGLHGAGHYMDDYIILVPPDRDAREILHQIQQKALELKLEINHGKTQIIPFGKKFRYCKTQWQILSTGRILRHCNKTTFARDKRKFYCFSNKVYLGEMTYERLYGAVNAMLAYFENYQNHNKLIQLRTLFHCLFGFFPDGIEEFRRRDRLNEILMLQEI